MTLTVKIHHQLYLQELNFEAELSSLITGLSGPSGIGKTTLLSIIAGLVSADSAFVSLDNQVWTDTDKKICIPTHQRNLAFVMQDVALFPNLNVQQNIEFSRHTKQKRALSVSTDELESLAEHLGIKQLLKQPVQKLSGGQKQRVALARAIYSKPQLLLLDEPFNGLDEENLLIAMDLLKNVIEKEQLPTIVVSHRKKELEYLTDQIIKMN